MIKNEKQYKITRKTLQGISEKLAAMLVNEPLSLKDELIKVSLIEMKTRMEQELEVYDQLKIRITEPFLERSIEELPDILIEFKIRMGLTQKQFAEKAGMKEQQLQRYESENFNGISFKNLLKILYSAGLEITVKGNFKEAQKN